MALVNMTQMLLDAKKGKYAVGHFNVINEEMLKGVLKASVQKNAPVIIAFAEAFEPLIAIEEFAPMAISAAKRVDIPVALHLDHANNIEYIKRAIDSGFTSAMLDASALPFEENVKMTNEVVALCKPKGMSVEAELGHVGGLEGYPEGYGDDFVYTEVEEAKEFVKQTGINALAVSIGTVHGVYKSEPKLNLKRLEELNEALDVPLVMHGGSGLTDDDFRNAVARGITKTNIFTDLTIAAMNALKNTKENVYLLQCIDVVNAVSAEATKKIDLFGTANRA